jgi:hypothetical protein
MALVQEGSRGLAQEDAALARTCLCRDGRLVRRSREASVHPHCVLRTQPGRCRPELHKSYCGKPFETTSSLRVTVPKLWPLLSAVQLSVCQVPFCVAELLMVS